MEQTLLEMCLLESDLCMTTDICIYQNHFSEKEDDVIADMNTYSIDIESLFGPNSSSKISIHISSVEELEKLTDTFNRVLKMAKKK